MPVYGENIVCGTATTGTGTLTLAACPSAIGGINPVTAFGTSGSPQIPYTLIEYTDGTFAKPLQGETGVAPLTLASSIGSATLARNPITTWSTSGPSYGGGSSAPAAISIGTAANCLVFIGANAHDIVRPMHFTAALGDGLGIGVAQGSILGGTNFAVVTSVIYYQAVRIEHSGLIQSASIMFSTAITSPASSSFSLALYDVGSDGLPGALLIDFGAITSNPASTTGIKTCQAAAARFITAGTYYLALLPIWSGGSGALNIRMGRGGIATPFGTNLGSLNGPIRICWTAAGQTWSGAWPDPASPTSPLIVYSSNEFEFAVAFRRT